VHCDLSLYLVTERAYTRDHQDFFFKIQRAILGGVTCIQLRDPDPQLCLETATALHSTQVPLIINNHIDVALKTQSGLHIGQTDIPYKEARRILGPHATIGLTVNTLEDVLAAESLDVDYLGVQVFPSKNTKPEQSLVWGLEGLKQVRALSSHRIVAIGGINLDNFKTVYSHLTPRKDGIALVGALLRGEDPFTEAQKILACL
jgi:thiamine-phosphate pyrophosphorylase